MIEPPKESIVLELTREDIRWSFNAEGPYVMFGRGTYQRSKRIDPFPAYAHDLTEVRKALSYVQQVFPVGFPPAVYVMHMEEITRMNGWTDYDEIYDDDAPKDAPKKWTPNIVLSGKRTPIHPAMTRYLIGHEYGHVVSQWLNYLFGNPISNNPVLRDYAKMRGMESVDYNGGKWHLHPMEVFANDFRILVTGLETEFWPHPTVDRPERVPEVVTWWAKRSEVLLHGRGQVSVPIGLKVE